MKNPRTEKQETSLARILEDSLNDIFIFSDTTLQFLWANRSGLENLGYTADEFSLLTPLDIKPDHTEDSFTLLVAPLRSGEEKRLNFETVHLRKDGSCYEVEIHLQMETYQSQPVFIAIILDITERRKLEDERLRRLERTQKERDAIARLSLEAPLPNGEIDQLLRSATRLVSDTLEVFRVAIWQMNDHRSQLHCLDHYESEQKEQSIMQTLEAKHYPDYFKALAFGTVIDAAEASTDPRTRELAKAIFIPLKIVSKLDAPIWVSGEFVGVVCLEHRGSHREWTPDEMAFARQVADQIALGLTNRERQKAEKLLRVNQRAIDSAVDGILVTDPTQADNRIIYVNPAMERITGYSSDEILGQSYLFLQNGALEQAGLQNLSIALAEEREIKVELLNHRKDDTPYWTELTISPVRNERDELINFIGFQSDVTEIKEAKNTRDELERKIVKISDDERRRIGQDLHDGLGSHLAGLALICKEHARILTSEGSAAAKRANEISAMVREAVTKSRTVAHGLYPVAEGSGGLMKALEDLVARNSSKGTRCYFDCVTPVLLHDNSIAIHLYRIAQEALTNALKHAGATEIIIDLSERRGEVFLEIIDNGCGFSSETPQDSDGIGLRTMDYRAKIIHGKLNRSSSPKTSGARIVCRCPTPFSASLPQSKPKTTRP